MALALAALFVALSAASASAEAFPRGVLIERVTCKADPSQTYTLYLPTGLGGERRVPVLLLFDPRGRSVLAAEIFRPAAERHGWILLSSNDTRSDGPWDPNVKAMRAIWPELERYPVDPRRVYAAGFSGGATVAWVLGRASGGLAGVISSGGLLPRDFEIEKVRFAHFGAAGDTDFNYAEMHRIDSLVAGRGLPHRLEIFEGRHQWMSPGLAADAIVWMELIAMKETRRERDAALVAEAFAAERAKADELEHAGRHHAALRRWEMIARTFDTLRPLDEVHARIAALSKKKEVEREKRQERAAADYEAVMLREIVPVVRQLVDGERRASLDEALSRLRVPQLQKNAREPTPRGVAARRILEWLFTRTSFYMTRDLFAAKRHRDAVLMLEIATSIRSDSAPVWYNLACARSQSRNVRGGLEALERALDAGWTDLERIEQDEDLDPIRDDARYGAIASRLRSE